MSKLWTYLSQKWGSKQTAPSSRPFLHESVDLKSYPVQDFLDWHTNGGSQALTAAVERAHTNYLIREVNDGDAVDILLSPSSNGFVLHCRYFDATTTDYKHFLFLMQQRLKEANYVVNLADVKSRDMGTYLETVYRHYLKPSIRTLSQKGKADQLFGNITLELVSKDSKPYVVKMLANNYSDQNYKAADDFNDLIKLLCKS